MGRVTAGKGRGRSTRASPGAVEFDPRDVFAALNTERVKYLVVGGVAAIRYGVPRATFDVDLAVQLEVSNLERVDRALQAVGFLPRVPASVLGLADPRTRREWTERKQMKVFSYVERASPFRLVDIMVRPLKRFEQLYRSRVKVNYDGVMIPLIPLQALIRMKQEAARLQDQLDVHYLQAAQQAERKRANS